MSLTISGRLALTAAATLAAAGAALALQDDVLLSLAQIGSACAALHNEAGATAQVKWVHWFEPVITCQLAGAGAVSQARRGQSILTRA